jgi:tetratricopeptide (TPR) repeat protein
MRASLTIAIAIWLAGSVPAFAIDFADPSGDRHARNEFEIGVDLVRNGKYVDATPHLEIALTKFPDDVSILKYLGFAHRMIAKDRTGTSHAGELRLAGEYYMRALDEDPDNRDFLQYMGELYLEMDDPAAAHAKMAALEHRCPEGCAQRDALAHAIADYVPPKPDAVPPPGSLSSDVTH